MDPLKLLGDVRGKVLDAINFDKLKSAYERKMILVLPAE